MVELTKEQNFKATFPTTQAVGGGGRHSLLPIVEVGAGVMVLPQGQKKQIAPAPQEGHALIELSPSQRFLPSSRDFLSTSKKNPSGGYLSDQEALANVVGPQLNYKLPLEKRWLTLVNPPDCLFGHSHRRFEISFPQASSTSGESTLWENSEFYIIILFN